MMKLTLVSVYCNGKTVSAFVPCPIQNGKTVLDEATLNCLLKQIGADKRGITYSVGAVKF